MYSITVRLSKNQVRLAVLHVLLQTFRSSSVLLVASSVVGGVCIMYAVDVVGANTLLSVTTGVSVGLMGWIALIAAIYRVNMRFVKRVVRLLPSTHVTYHLSTEGCAVSSDAWNGFLPWHSFCRLVRRPYMLMLEMVDHRPKREMTKSLRAALETTSADEAIAAQTRAFPVFWVLPVPYRTFLVLPAAALNDQQIAFINDLHHRTRGSL